MLILGPFLIKTEKKKDWFWKEMKILPYKVPLFWLKDARGASYAFYIFFRGPPSGAKNLAKLPKIRLIAIFLKTFTIFDSLTILIFTTP